jgi:hypothetical protein
MVMLRKELPEEEEDPAPEFDMLPICHGRERALLSVTYSVAQRRDYLSNASSNVSRDSIWGVVS